MARRTLGQKEARRALDGGRRYSGSRRAPSIILCVNSPIQTKVRIGTLSSSEYDIWPFLYLTLIISTGYCQVRDTFKGNWSEISQAARQSLNIKSAMNTVSGASR